MNKILIFFMLVCLSFSVFGYSTLNDVTETSSYNKYVSFFNTVQTYFYYEDILTSYIDLNLSTSTTTNLIGLDGLNGRGDKTDLSAMTIQELEELQKILIENNYVDGKDSGYIPSYIEQRKIEENKTYSKYLEYESLKNTQKENINKIWVHIVSFTQLFIEMLNIGIYLLGFYLFVFVVVEAIPLGLISARDMMLENFLKRRRNKRK